MEAEQVIREAVRDGRWYFVLTIPAGWLLAAIPVFHASARLKWQRLRREGTLFAATGALTFIAVYFIPLRQLQISLAALGSTVAAARSARIRHFAYTLPHHDPEWISRDRRERRYNARKLVALNPHEADARRIGHPTNRPSRIPDPRDGGLVDVNRETVYSISHGCEISTEEAESVVQAREKIGRYTSLQEVVTRADLRDLTDVALREHGVIYPDTEDWDAGWRSRFARWSRWHLRREGFR
ncbi:hypothetical protein [Streptomyces sp. MZ04]|uniref:hypothetical protein n=1 Tax=Streptomyces sp. MZ04 TaxID=2559236 RepID=UPI00107E662C|nr:hypothetical protein [Streptomyces sp. MZ04]TGB16314.1 hypothetical protein E2651_00550 [Streptomyces sp. MZ04]